MYTLHSYHFLFWVHPLWPFNCFFFFLCPLGLLSRLSVAFSLLMPVLMLMYFGGVNSLPSYQQVCSVMNLIAYGWYDFSGGQASDETCYRQFNVDGVIYGNCGRHQNGSYIKCEVGWGHCIVLYTACRKWVLWCNILFKLISTPIAVIFTDSHGLCNISVWIFISS